MSDLYSLIDSAGDFLPGFSFMLRVDGWQDVPLKSVRAFTRENEYDYIQEGGQNDFVYIKRKPVSKPFTLVCERYIPTQLNDPLSNGTELTLPLMLFVGKNVGGKFDALNAGRYYVFTGAVIMSKEYGGLDAEKSGLLTETVTIGYNRMFCVTNPVDESSKPAWQMNEDGDPDSAGNTKQMYSKSGKQIEGNSATKQTFIGNARKWEFDETDKAGNGEVSSDHSRIKEDSKKKMQEAAHLYDFAAENNKNYKNSNKSQRSAQNEMFSDRTLGENMGINELSKDKMMERARKFEFTDANSIAGNKQLSSQRHSEAEETRLPEMMKRATSWAFDGRTKAGNGVGHTQNSLVTEHSEAPDGSSTGLGLAEASKEEMAKNAAAPREFGTISGEPAKDEFKANGKLWDFDGTTKAGKGASSAKHLELGGTVQEDGTEGAKVTEEGKDVLASRAILSEFGGVKEPVKEQFTKNAVQHVKVTIEDFLMK